MHGQLLEAELKKRGHVHAVQTLTQAGSQMHSISGLTMMKTCLRWIAVALLVTPPVCAAFYDPLPAAVQAALAQAGLPADALGAIAIPQTFWARTWQHRADVAMQPGSAMKLVTTIVALDRLGPNHRGRTALHTTGAVSHGVLDGDLVLVGGADPDFDLPALWQLLFELRQRGVHTVNGGLVLDRTLFQPGRIDIGLPPFDESPEWPYNVIPDALMLNGNLMGLALSSTESGAVTARLAPPLDGVSIDTSAFAPGNTACADWDDDWLPPRVSEASPGQWRIALQGGFPRRCEAQAALQLLDRNVITERELRAVWASLGGKFTSALGSVREAALPAGAERIAQHDSRPWGEVLRHMNKASDNAQTRLLFLQLGAAAMMADPNGTTLTAAQRDVQRWFDEQRIARDGLVMDNGSGLSRSERIAPRTMARAIEVAINGKHAPELLMSLPVAGVDGTMRNRLKGTRAEGWARLKTGTLKNVTALAGTVRDTRGDAWVVVAFINHDDAAKGRPALDALIEWVANSGARWR
jgi:serine-type D-Ala-D-Ala carboxypeptidase/endopeptidase (penicillin-binding protein 4)